MRLTFSADAHSKRKPLEIEVESPYPVRLRVGPGHRHEVNGWVTWRFPVTVDRDYTRDDDGAQL